MAGNDGAAIDGGELVVESCGFGADRDD